MWTGKRRLREWILRKLPDRDKLRQSYLHRLFGRHILSHDLWQLDARCLAGGISLGVFIAFTPTIPFHMVLACVGALYFRVNLPASLLACWAVSNPLTAVPIYLMGWRLGRSVLQAIPFLHDILTVYADGKHGTFVTTSFYLWTGSLLLAAAAALASNLLLRWLWKEVAIHQHHKHEHNEPN